MKRKDVRLVVLLGLVLVAVFFYNSPKALRLQRIVSGQGNPNVLSLNEVLREIHAAKHAEEKAVLSNDVVVYTVWYDKSSIVGPYLLTKWAVRPWRMHFWDVEGEWVYVSQEEEFDRSLAGEHTAIVYFGPGNCLDFIVPFLMENSKLTSEMYDNPPCYDSPDHQAVPSSYAGLIRRATDLYRYQKTASFWTITPADAIFEFYD